VILRVAFVEIWCYTEYPKIACATRKKRKTDQNKSIMTNALAKSNKGMNEYEKENKPEDKPIFSSLYATYTFAGTGICDACDG